MSRIAAAGFVDTQYFISASVPTTYDKAGYEALTDFKEISHVQSFPEIGLDQGLNEFVPIRGAVEYTKGAKRYGNGPLVMADIPSDEGQQLLATVVGATAHGSIKVVYADGEVHYLDVQAAGWRLSAADESGTRLRTTNIGVCRAPVVVDAPGEE